MLDKISKELEKQGYVQTVAISATSASEIEYIAAIEGQTAQEVLDMAVFEYCQSNYPEALED